MKLALLGYGRMGRAVEAVALEEGHAVVLRVDGADAAREHLTPEGLRGVDVAVDFSRPEAVLPNILRSAEAGVDLVVGTTGWYDGLDEARTAVEGAGVGLLYAPNFSLGVQLFFRLVRAAGRLADAVEEYDPYVTEVHHRHKADHPSGTARRLAEILLEEVGRKASWEMGPGEGTVAPDRLQVSVLRAGEVPGIHTVGLAGPDDRIQLRHEAGGRTGFARGAVRAAAWIRGRKGIHTMDDLIEDGFRRIRE